MIYSYYYFKYSYYFQIYRKNIIQDIQNRQSNALKKVTVSNYLLLFYSVANIYYIIIKKTIFYWLGFTGYM